MPSDPTGALEVRSDVRLSPRLRELTVSSRALGTTSSFRVLTPSGATDTSGLPVLWLLHGGDDDYRSWTGSGDAEQLTEGLDLIVVMPDNGPGGWYSNWFRTDSAAGLQQWETYHLDELRPWIEREYRTRTDRGGRAIAGLSMGGFGTMSYAGRHPDLFVFAAAFSGAVDIIDPLLGPFADALAQLNGGEPGCIWGDRETHLTNWRAHNPVDLAQNLGNLRLELRTGNGQPGGVHGGDPDLIETTVHLTSTTLHSTLEDLDIDHVWQDYGPGDHSWAYWQDDLRATLPGIMESFGSEPDRQVTEHGHPVAGERVQHVTYDVATSVWGWSLDFVETPSDVTRLDIGHGDIEIVGAGAARLRTPPVFEPGSVVRLATSSGPVETAADPDGRATLPIVLSAETGSRFTLAWADGELPVR